MEKFWLVVVITLTVIVNFSSGHLGHEHEHEHDHENNNSNQELDSKWSHAISLKKTTGVDLQWNTTDPDWVFMEMKTKTTGYVAVGFCTVWKGSMEGCDIVVGWVDENGMPNIKDYHAENNEHPTLDNSQDYHLTHGKQVDYTTTIGFKRKWDTKDPKDTVLGQGKVQIIYAWHPIDPKSPTEIPPHDINTRGHTTEMVKLQDSVMASSGPSQFNPLWILISGLILSSGGLNNIFNLL